MRVFLHQHIHRYVYENRTNIGDSTNDIYNLSSYLHMYMYASNVCMYSPFTRRPLFI